VVGPHYPGNLFHPSPLSFLEPPLQSSKQDSVSGLHLPVRLGVLDRREHLLYADLCTELAQLLAGKLCAVVGDKTPWYAKATHDILAHKILHLVSRDLCYQLDFNPLREVFDDHYQYFICLIANENGPRMSIPHVWKGHEL